MQIAEAAESQGWQADRAGEEGAGVFPLRQRSPHQPEGSGSRRQALAPQAIHQETQNCRRYDTPLPPRPPPPSSTPVEPGATYARW